VHVADAADLDPGDLPRTREVTHRDLRGRVLVRHDGELERLELVLRCAELDRRAALLRRRCLPPEHAAKVPEPSAAQAISAAARRERMAVRGRGPGVSEKDDMRDTPPRPS